MIKILNKFDINPTEISRKALPVEGVVLGVTAFSTLSTGFGTQKYQAISGQSQGFFQKILKKLKNPAIKNLMLDLVAVFTSLTVPFASIGNFLRVILDWIVAGGSEEDRKKANLFFPLASFLNTVGYVSLFNKNRNDQKISDRLSSEIKYMEKYLKKETYSKEIPKNFQASWDLFQKKGFSKEFSELPALAEVGKNLHVLHGLISLLAGLFAIGGLVLHGLQKKRLRKQKQISANYNNFGFKSFKEHDQYKKDNFLTKISLFFNKISRIPLPFVTVIAALRSRNIWLWVLSFVGIVANIMNSLNASNPKAYASSDFIRNFSYQLTGLLRKAERN